MICTIQSHIIFLLGELLSETPDGLQALQLPATTILKSHPENRGNLLQIIGPSPNRNISPQAKEFGQMVKTSWGTCDDLFAKVLEVGKGECKAELSVLSVYDPERLSEI